MDSLLFDTLIMTGAAYATWHCAGAGSRVRGGYELFGAPMAFLGLVAVWFLLSVAGELVAQVRALQPGGSLPPLAVLASAAVGGVCALCLPIWNAVATRVRDGGEPPRRRGPFP